MRKLICTFLIFQLSAFNSHFSTLSAQNPFVQTNCLAAWPLVSPTRKTTGDDLQTKDYKAFTAKANGATSLHDLYLCTDEAEGDISLNWWKFK